MTDEEWMTSGEEAAMTDEEWMTSGEEAAMSHDVGEERVHAAGDVELSLAEAAETLQGLAENLKDLALFISAGALPGQAQADWRFSCDRAMEILDALKRPWGAQQGWDVWLALASSIVASVARAMREAIKEKG